MTVADAGLATVRPAARWAGKIIPFQAPLLRIRYPHGLYVTLAGYVDWLPYARALVALPPIAGPTERGRQRVTDVLTANLAMAASGDPLWAGDNPEATPDGWLWRHLPDDRRVALVPAEAAVAYRHAGGLAVAGLPDGDSGLAAGAGSPAEFEPAEPVAPEDLEALQRDLPGPLPAAYREFLRRHGAARPARPVVHPECGFLLDQSFLHPGQGRKNLLGSVGYLRRWFGDRFTGDILAVARVQGGLLALRLTDPEAGSVWFWDFDDPRDDDRYDAAVVTRDLLGRCADSFEEFLARLAPPPEPLVAAARDAVARGLARSVPEPGMGASLLARDRPPATEREGMR